MAVLYLIVVVLWLYQQYGVQKSKSSCKSALLSHHAKYLQLSGAVGVEERGCRWLGLASLLGAGLDERRVTCMHMPHA